jgi:hypothetical protein
MIRPISQLSFAYLLLYFKSPAADMSDNRSDSPWRDKKEVLFLLVCDWLSSCECPHNKLGA